MQLSIANVVNISVSASQTGLGEYNVNNLALFTSDTAGSTFGSAGYALYLDPTQVGVDFGTDSLTYEMANQVFSQSPNILAGGGYLAVIPFATGSETLAAAITRTVGLVQYFGVMTNSILGSASLMAAAEVIQPLDKLLFFGSRTSGDLASPSGLFATISEADLTQSRGLYYGGSTDALCLSMVAAYAGRALSTNFDGSNTTSTMHLKDLVGVVPDPTITQTLLNQAVAAGADTYVSLQGVAKVFTSGANSFFDQVYNQLAFSGDLQVAVFNYLAESDTKVPQTEQGMSGLKSAMRAVCVQYVNNGYLAPGQWNSSTTFGDQQNFINNVSNLGFYLYSQPVAQQSQANRAARQAPLCQLAVKEAGAIQSADLIVYVNS